MCVLMFEQLITFDLNKNNYHLMTQYSYVGRSDFISYEYLHQLELLVYSWKVFLFAFNPVSMRDLRLNSRGVFEG